MAGTLIREQPDLTAHDRCDACSAQAYVRVRKDAAELVFCSHDYARLRGSLADGGWTLVTDVRERLLSAP